MNQLDHVWSDKEEVSSLSWSTISRKYLRCQDFCHDGGAKNIPSSSKRLLSLPCRKLLLHFQTFSCPLALPRYSQDYFVCQASTNASHIQNKSIRMSSLLGQNINASNSAL
ncbi:unnamed protein product [Albugo candida]|uniref:Uncharacterized protein n=1 Tax=Albugo candida TaxID=65357 RepID=A0A024G0N7_9STRA|nr:unnamed protein product [Albugo candida]|eukprot:CCI40135.1 unnamed protein product [Albugo candida]